MLPERARRALLRDLLDAASRLLAAAEGDKATITQAMLASESLRAEMNDGYECDISDHFHAVYEKMRAFASTADSSSRTSLQEAFLKARGYAVDGITGATRTLTTYYGGGVQGVFTENPDRLLLEVKIKPLCERFGAPIVANLLRAMAGANRIITLLHFIQLTLQHVPPASVAFERNRQFASMQTFAYLKELSGVLNDLRRVGIERHLTDRQPWFTLQTLQSHWERGSRKTLRDDVLFHLGWPTETRRAVEKEAQTDERVVLVEGDADRIALHSRFTAGESLLLVACGLKLSDFREIVESGATAYDPLFDSLEAIFDDLLRQCGAKLPPRPRRGSEDD